MIELKPNQNASQRTKNRIKEHGPEFKFEFNGNPMVFKGEPCMFVRSGDWCGWFPISEIEVGK